MWFVLPAMSSPPYNEPARPPHAIAGFLFKILTFFIFYHKLTLKQRNQGAENALLKFWQNKMVTNERNR